MSLNATIWALEIPTFILDFVIHPIKYFWFKAICWRDLVTCVCHVAFHSSFPFITVHSDRLLIDVVLLQDYILEGKRKASIKALHIEDSGFFVQNVARFSQKMSPGFVFCHIENSRLMAAWKFQIGSDHPLYSHGQLMPWKNTSFPSFFSKTSNSPIFTGVSKR